MVKAIHGDPIVDAEAVEIRKEVRKVDSKLCSNLSLQGLKDMLRDLRHAAAEAEFWQTTVIQKTVNH